jgi:hypothetical protein
MTRQTLGKLPPGAFGMLELPALPPDIVVGFGGLEEMRRDRHTEAAASFEVRLLALSG